MGGRERLLELRVATGAPDQKLASGIWRIWQGKNNNDIYVAPRPVAGAVKVSLHANGYCYCGFTKQYSERLLRDGHYVPPRREFVAWQRPPTPDNNLLWAVEIWFPPGPLFEPGQLLPKNTWLIEPPPNGKAVVISVGFSRIPKGEAVITPDVRELGHSRLSTGEYVVVFARPVDFDYEAFKAQHQQQLRSRSGQGHLIASEEQILSVKHPRMFGLNDPKVEGFLKILDAAATISRAP